MLIGIFVFNVLKYIVMQHGKLLSDFDKSQKLPETLL